MPLNRSVVAVIVIAALAMIATPSQASAASCSLGGSSVTYSYGQAAVFKNLTTYRNMNCASARYVLNKWLRPSYQRTGRLPYSFYDGYVTWHCSKLTRTRWQCNEYDSNTAFRFTGYRV